MKTNREVVGSWKNINNRISQAVDEVLGMMKWEDVVFPQNLTTEYLLRMRNLVPRTLLKKNILVLIEEWNTLKKKIRLKLFFNFLS